jgi:hypothetical protein
VSNLYDVRRCLDADALRVCGAFAAGKRGQSFTPQVARAVSTLGFGVTD